MASGRFGRALLVLLAVGTSGTATASPELVWSGDWRVVSETIECGWERVFPDQYPPGSTCPTWGRASFAADGDALVAHAWRDPGGDAAASGMNSGLVRVELARDFTVSGSSQGWRIELSADLAGSLLAGATGGGSASAEASASVSSAGSVVASVEFDRVGVTAGSAIPFPTATIDETRADEAIAFDGSYTVGATLYVDAYGGGPPGSFAASSADLRVALRAAPVPEPGSSCLVCIGLALVASRRGTHARPGGRASADEAERSIW